MSVNSEPKPQSAHATVLSYAIATILTIAALLLAVLFGDIVRGRYMFIFLGTVVLSAYWGGLGPGLVASLLSVLLAGHFLIEPLGSVFRDVDDLFLLCVFVVFSVFISWIEETKARSERALQEAKSQLEAILQGVADGITARNLAGQMVFANEAAAQLTGYPSAKALMETPTADRQNRYELFDETGNPVAVSTLPARRTLSDGIPNERTFLMRHRETGEERWLIVKSAPVLAGDGRPHMAINILQDITARKKAEEERLHLILLIEQQRRRMQTILNNVPGIVWEAKANPNTGRHEMVFVSNYAQQMLGYTAEEWLTMPDFWEKVVHPDDWHKATEQINTIFENPKPGTLEFRLVAKDGHPVLVETQTATLTDEMGQPIGACGVFMDISERKQHEERLARFAVELQRSNKELEQFAYVASHDLQEPLRMVGSYLQLIESRYADKLDDEGREFIAFAVDGASRMKDLISGLLTYSRVETQPKNFQRVDSQQAFEQACKLLVVTIEEVGATITGDSLPQIMADEQQIVQLFQNLIGNALKYRSERKPEIHVRAVRKNDQWVFSVRDNGIGIEAQYLERIFVIFQRLHGRGNYSGTGIGLSVCKKVVERHGGRIWAESEVGKGTTFYFTIPA